MESDPWCFVVPFDELMRRLSTTNTLFAPGRKVDEASRLRYS